jgi:hypothetical protein
MNKMTENILIKYFELKRRVPATIYTCYSLVVIMIFIILSVDLAIPLGVNIPIIYGVVVLFSLRCLNTRFIVFVAIASSILIVFCFFYKPPIEEMWKALVNRSLALMVIWIIAFLGLQKRAAEETRERALVERVLRPTLNPESFPALF